MYVNRRFTPGVYYIVFLVKALVHKLTMAPVQLLASVIIVQNFSFDYQ